MSQRCLHIPLLSYLFLFFFSSRRRHTRSLRDWSSDVCSSDLLKSTLPSLPISTAEGRPFEPLSQGCSMVQMPPAPPSHFCLSTKAAASGALAPWLSQKSTCRSSPYCWRSLRDAGTDAPMQPGQC